MFFAIVFLFSFSSQCVCFQSFVQNLAKTEGVQMCQDKAKILPGCTQCIPGTELNTVDGTCSIYSPKTSALRNDIQSRTEEKFPSTFSTENLQSRFGLYPSTFLLLIEL